MRPVVLPKWDISFFRLPKGSSQSLMDLAGNQIDMQFDNMATAPAFAKNGQTKALAVTSLKRSALKLDLPTLAESGVRGLKR